MSTRSREALRGARRVVVKVGTAVVASGAGLALGRLGSLVEQLHRLRGAGREVMLVTSGAIGVGARKLGLPTPVVGVVDRQACAAAGQGALMALYDTLFRQLGMTSAQILLTEGDFLHRTRYLALHATLERLLGLGVVPIINENDTVSTAQLAEDRDPRFAGKVFGDNDRLAALVAAGVDADLLVMMSNVDGVYNAPPGEPGATRISTWADRTRVSFAAPSAGGRGGMQSKIAAAEVATRAGADALILSGLVSDSLSRALDGEELGTWFPARVAWSRRRRWLAWAAAPAGRVMVNAGARDAIVGRNASLLAAGVDRVEGEFEPGAVVLVVGPDGGVVARGISGWSAAAIRGGEANMGRKALVHRNDLVLLGEDSA